MKCLFVFCTFSNEKLTRKSGKLRENGKHYLCIMPPSFLIFFQIFSIFPDLIGIFNWIKNINQLNKFNRSITLPYPTLNYIYILIILYWSFLSINVKVSKYTTVFQVLIQYFKFIYKNRLILLGLFGRFYPVFILFFNKVSLFFLQ